MMDHNLLRSSWTFQGLWAFKRQLEIFEDSNIAKLIKGRVLWLYKILAQEICWFVLKYIFSQC